MIIRRASRPRQFTIVDLALMNDERLTADALGVLLYLLSKPDDWRVFVDQLQKRFGMGRDKLQGVMRLLRECGYATLEQMSDPVTGRLIGKGYSIHDDPGPAEIKATTDESQTENQEGPTDDIVAGDDEGATPSHREPENPALGEPSTESRVFRRSGFPTVGKPGYTHNKELKPNTDVHLSPQPPAKPGGTGGGDFWIEFEKSWIWDPLDIRDQARRAFERLDAVDQQSASRYAKRYCELTKARDRQLPSARTWLRDHGWENLAKNAASAATTPTTHVQIWAGSPQAAAWARHEGKPKLLMVEMRAPNGRLQLGTMRPTEWPPAKASADNAKMKESA